MCPYNEIRAGRERYTSHSSRLDVEFVDVGCLLAHSLSAGVPVPCLDPQLLTT